MPITIGAIGLGTGLATKGYNMWRANQDEQKAKSALNELSKTPMPEYKITPQMQSYYSTVLGGVNNPMGMTAAEKAGAKAGVANAINTTLYNAKGQTGGNMSRYLTAALTPQIATTANQVAIADANMRNSNYGRNLGMLGGVTSTIQNIKNMNTKNQIQQRLMKEQMLGYSALQNKGFQTKSLEGIGSDLMGAGLMLGMNGMSNSPTARPFNEGDIVSDQANAVAKGFYGVPNPTYGFLRKR